MIDQRKVSKSTPSDNAEDSAHRTKGIPPTQDWILTAGKCFGWFLLLVAGVLLPDATDANEQLLSLNSRSTRSVPNKAIVETTEDYHFRKYIYWGLVFLLAKAGVACLIHIDRFEIRRSLGPDADKSAAFLLGRWFRKRMSSAAG